MRNIFGVENAFEVSNIDTTFSLTSRYFGFPAPEDRFDLMVNRWRSEDFNMKDDILTMMNTEVANHANALANSNLSPESSTSTSLTTFF